MPAEGKLKPYITITGPSKTEIVIHKSRFIGECFPVKSEQEVNERLAEIRSGYWDASHHCYAYSIGASGEYSRFSDDGEPSGTAGMPMMEALRFSGVTDTLCVVTRYFGGILLGTGGLVKAYSGSCKSALESAKKVLMAPASQYDFSIPYPLYSVFSRISEKYAEVEGTDFEDIVRCRLHVRKEKESSFLSELTEKSNGQLSGKKITDSYYPFSL